MKRATQGAETVHVHAPPERVYALVSDLTGMGEWSPETDAAHVTNVSGR